jgi:ribonuclease HI
MTNSREASLASRHVIFCDGAAKGNPGPGGWGAIVFSPEGRVREYGGGAARVTNNQMELLAVINALAALYGVSGDVVVFADSTYVLHGIKSWVYGWKRRGWTTAEGNPVANADLWQQLDELVSKRRALGSIEWQYVRGHSGTPGNERVDAIATTFAENKRPKLFDGPLLQYDVPLFDLPEDTSVPEMNFNHLSKPKAPAAGYVSCVDGVVQVHATWAECEARVKGRSGAKFKKAATEEEIQRLIRQFS